MHRIRPIRESDFIAVHKFIRNSGVGLLSLPKNEGRLKAVVTHASRSFLEKVKDPFYLFILEDMERGEPVGTTGIFAKTAINDYLYLEPDLLPPLYPEVPHQVSLLKRVEHIVGSSEIGALFLTPKARNEGLGKLLSFSRFHFLAAFRKRFTREVFATLRGVIDENGNSLFWDAIGRHFFPVSFKKLMIEREVDENCALDLMPRFPIYLELLPESAQKLVGEPHPEGRAAFEMLLKQGFKKTGEIDIYDGGPKVAAKVSEIKTVKESQVFQIQSIENLERPSVLLSNEKIHFRSCFGKIDPEKGSIDPKSAKALEVIDGDLIRWSP